MIAPFRLAFGSARVRAMRSRLLVAAEGSALLAAADAAAVAALADPTAPASPRELERRAMQRVAADYEKLVASFPGGSALLLALFRRHEVESLKVVLRLASAGSASAGRGLLPPLGRLARLDPARLADAASPEDVVAIAARTPFAEPLRAALDAHGGDAAAVEAALDRWAKTRVLEEARRLPRREWHARSLAIAWIRERDVDLLLRSAALELAPEAAAEATVALKMEARREELAQLAAWSPGTTNLAEALPHSLLRLAPRARTGDDLRRALAAHTKTLCRRAFLGNPFRLGPAVAYLFLREAEARALGAIAESKVRAAPPSALELALAPSLLGT